MATVRCKKLLKGQCHKIVDTFLCSKDTFWALNEQAKTVSQIFLFSLRYFFTKFENHVSPYIFIFFKLLLLGM